MASTFLDEKISSFIEDKFPEFVKADHPVFVDFLRLYYQFMEAAKITLTNVQLSDQILLENLLTENFLINEDGTKFVFEDSQYGAFLKGETVTGQTSGAVATILAEDNASGFIYVEQNRFLQVGEVIVGGTSAASATIFKYQGNPVQNIQQLLEYVDVDKTITDFLDHFRNTYLTAVPNTLASGVSKRKLIKSIRDLYRAKGTKKGHEIFFRLMFGETPELFFPTDNLLKISAGDWSTDTVIRVVATANSPNNLVGQTITQTIDVLINAVFATATVESVLQLQEGETTVYQLILNLDSIVGTFITGGEITGVDNTNPDLAISATIQSIITDATVTSGATAYTNNDDVTVTSGTGKDAIVNIVDVGSGEVDQIVIDNPGTGYAIGDNLFFNNANTEGSGASATVTNIGGAIAPELGDTTDHTVTGNTNGTTSISNITTSTLYAGQKISGGSLPAGTTIVSISVVGSNNNGTIIVSNVDNATATGVSFTIASEYGISNSDHIIFEPATESTDAYSGAQIQFETDTFANLDTQGDDGPHDLAYGYFTGIVDEKDEIVNIRMNSKGSGYEVLPTVIPTKYRLHWSTYALTTSGTFIVGESISNDAIPAITATIATLNAAKMSVASPTGSFSSGQVITGATSGAIATLTTVDTLGDNATFVAWSTSGIGSVTGVEVASFGTGFTTAPTITVPVKLLITRNTALSEPTDVSLANAFAVGDTITGQTSNAVGVITAWDNTRQILTIKMTTGTYTRAEVFTRGSTTNYAVVSEISQATLGSTIGVVGATAGAFDNDKGKISESLMKIQDSYYYQDFSYVVRVGAAIASWRSEIKKAVHPAGFAMFGEVSLTNQVSMQINVPVSGITTATPELASLFEAVLTTVFGRRLGTADAGSANLMHLDSQTDPPTNYTYGTTLLGETEMKGTTDHGVGTLKRGSHYGHKTPLTTSIESITLIGTTATVETAGSHGIEVGELVQITGVDTDGYNGTFETISGQFTVTGNTTSGSTSVTNITTTNINATTLHSITGSGITADVTRINSITQSGSSNNGTIALTHAATATATGVTFTVTPISVDQFKITVAAGLTTPAVLSSAASVLLISPFDNSTRDLTMRSHKDIDIFPIYGGWATNQRDRYGLGPRQSNATKYMWAAPPITDTTPSRMDNIGYAYPNIIRRGSPETGTDNVDAGTAGVYDTTMEYTNIQIGTHESDVHMRISDFADVRIIDTVRALRTVGESGTADMENNGDDVDCILMEDGSYEAYEDAEGNVMPLESRKIWNVPPPSYIRLITA